MIRSRRAAIIVVIAELLFIGYMVSQAITRDDWTRPWYVVGAMSLAVLTGIVWWTRLRRSP